MIRINVTSSITLRMKITGSENLKYSSIPLHLSIATLNISVETTNLSKSATKKTEDETI